MCRARDHCDRPGPTSLSPGPPPPCPPLHSVLTQTFPWSAPSHPICHRMLVLRVPTGARSLNLLLLHLALGHTSIHRPSAPECYPAHNKTHHYHLFKTISSARYSPRKAFLLTITPNIKVCLKFKTFSHLPFLDNQPCFSPTPTRQPIILAKGEHPVPPNTPMPGVVLGPF